MNYLLSNFGDEQCMRMETSPCFSPALKAVLLAQSHAPIRPEVEGFCDKDFMLPEVESLRVQSLWLLKKLYPQSIDNRSIGGGLEDQTSVLSITNSKARFYTRFYTRTV